MKLFNTLNGHYPGSIPIDPLIDNRYNDMNLPEGDVNYIFSSHCLEHVDNWVNTLRYWEQN